jgi:ketosteroid isomerase-like protein
VKVVVVVRLHYYLPVRNSSARFANRELHTAVKQQEGGGSMNRSFVILVLGSLAMACTATVNTRNSPSSATENSLIQADRDFAVATHARGIDGWMSFYAPDAIRIRYRGNMVRGFEEIRKFDLPNISDTTSILNWEPTDAYVFNGGSIGSTTGRYSVVSRRAADAGKELGSGRYVTMWRRDGGRWLVIMDTGYPNPPVVQ